MGKKAQTAASAAILLAIIAGVMLMIIIVVSPEDREAILNDAVLDGQDDVDNLPSETLIEEFPGKIYYLSLDEMEHSLASVRIYTKEESSILAEKFSAYAKNGLFSEEKAKFDISLEDKDNTRDVILSFTVEDILGNLKIEWNGEEIFNSKVESGATPIINIPQNLLSSNNEITYSMSSPGVAFWKTNFIALKNIKVIGYVTQLGYQSASNTFLISETEYSNMESVVLRFQPECDYESVGRLNVKVNNVEIYNGVPDCGLEFVPIEFSKDVIQEGENTLSFYTDKGEYILLHLKVISELKSIEYPTYYFELSLEEYEHVDDVDNFVKATLEFIDDSTRKIGYVQINGHKYHFDTREDTYVIDISDDVVRGNNAVKVMPSKTLELREFKVQLK